MGHVHRIVLEDRLCVAMLAEIGPRGHPHTLVLAVTVDAVLRADLLPRGGKSRLQEPSDGMAVIVVLVATDLHSERWGS